MPSSRTRSLLTARTRHIPAAKIRATMLDFLYSIHAPCCFYYLLIFLLYFRPQRAHILHKNVVYITTLILLTLALWEAYYRGSF